MAVVLERRAATAGLGAVELASLYRQHHRLVRWLVRSRGIAEHAVDDVTQEVFVAIQRRWMSAPADDVRHWIVGVTRSVCHTHQRANAREHARRLQLSAPPSPSSAEDRVDARRAVERLDRALARLAPGQRDVFVLVEIEGASVPEAARALGLNLATAYSRLRLARGHLLGGLGLDATIIALARTAGADAHRDAQTGRARAGLALPWWRRPWVAAAIRAGLLGLGLAATAIVIRTATPEPGPLASVRRSSPPFGTPSMPPPTPATLPVHVNPSPAPVAQPRPSTRAPPAARIEVPRTSAPAVRSDDPLAREAALLRHAARRLDAGDPSGAHALLDDHLRRFPHGALVDERERLRSAARSRAPAMTRE